MEWRVRYDVLAVAFRIRDGRLVAGFERSVLPGYLNECRVELHECIFNSGILAVTGLTD